MHRPEPTLQSLYPVNPAPVNSARPYDLILFDLDGTLIETAPEIADAVNDTLQEQIGRAHV